MRLWPAQPAHARAGTLSARPFASRKQCGSTDQTGPNIDLENVEVDATATHTFRRRATSTFDAASAANVDLANNTIKLTAHGLAGGDVVSLRPGKDDDTVIGGLEDQEVFYAIPAGPDHIRLAITPADAADNNPVDLTSLGVGNHVLRYEQAAKSFNPKANVLPAENSITLTGNGYVDGDEVAYRTDASKFKEVANTKTTTFDPAATTSAGDVDLAANTFRATAHNFETGQQIVYLAGAGTAIGTSAGALVEGTTYFAINVEKNKFKIASSRANASAGTAIDLTAAGTGATQAFETDRAVTTFEGGRSEPIVDLTANTIEIIGHGLANNDHVKYMAAGGEVVGGLSDEDDYFAIVVDANHLKLSLTEGGAAIDLTLRGTVITSMHGLGVSTTAPLQCRVDLRRQPDQQHALADRPRIDLG